MSLAIVITDAGISGPDYQEILDTYKASYRGIYGSDVNLDNDTQDGQWLAVQAQMLFDVNMAAIDVFNSFSPINARGVGLSSLVKLNGLRRNSPTRSTALVEVTGVVGTTINNGVATDAFDVKWSLPASVVIPVSGSIVVTATAQEAGATRADANTITRINTPTLGWQTVNNPASSTPGQPVEKDAELRLRQGKSTALPAQSILEGIYSAVGEVAGVNRLTIKENKTDSTDADGVPSHTISVVVSGGDSQDVAETIAAKKTPGTGTYGDVSVSVVDSHGVPSTIDYYELSEISILVQVSVHALPGYTSTTGDVLKQRVMDFVNTLDIGENSYRSRLYSPANMQDTTLSETFVVTSIRQSKKPGIPTTSDVGAAFYEAFVIESVDDVEVVLV